MKCCKNDDIIDNIIDDEIIIFSGKASEAVNKFPKNINVSSTLSLASGMDADVKIIADPKILFLDEPTSGLDPTLSLKVHQILFHLKNKGVTIFLTTHDMNEATKLCDNIALLYQGEIIEYGAPKDIINKYADDNKVVITFQNGKEITIPKEETANYLGEFITSIHSLETSLESIFIQLTGKKEEK